MTLRRNLTLFLTLLFSIVMFHSQFLQAQDREIPTLTGEPVAPLLLSPVDGSQNIGRKPTFSWTETTGATRYTLVIKQNGNVKRRLKFDAAQICVDGVCTVDTSLLPDFKRLRKNRNYCWFVKVHTPEGNLKSIPARFRVNPQLRGVDCDITNPCTETPDWTPTSPNTETPTLTYTPTTTNTRTHVPGLHYCYEWDFTTGARWGRFDISSITGSQYMGTWDGTSLVSTYNSARRIRGIGITKLMPVYFDINRVEVEYLAIYGGDTDAGEPIPIRVRGFPGGGGIAYWTGTGAWSDTLTTFVYEPPTHPGVSRLELYGTSSKDDAWNGKPAKDHGGLIQFRKIRVYFDSGRASVDHSSVGGAFCDASATMTPESPTATETSVVVPSDTPSLTPTFTDTPQPTATDTAEPTATHTSGPCDPNVMRSPNCQGVSPTPDDDDLTATASAPTLTPSATFTPTIMTVPVGCVVLIQTEGQPPANAKLRYEPRFRVENEITRLAHGTEVDISGKSYDLDNPQTGLWYLIEVLPDRALKGWAFESIIANLPDTPQCRNIPFVNTHGQTATPTFTPTPTFTATPSETRHPSVTPSATPKVAPQAVPFHLDGHVFGLPVPFNTFPYSYNTSDEYYGWYNGFPLYVTGFGSTAFAFEHRNDYYDDTSGIHTGLDFGHADGWDNATVKSLCDGIVIPSRNYGTDGHGGTVTNGRGVSVRCFLAPLSYLNDNDVAKQLKVDPDNDGIPNLSNIVVVYDHLETATLVTLYQIVYQGTDLGITNEDLPNTYDHLHLEVYLARGYYRYTSDPAILLHPLLLFREREAAVISNWTFSRYHPYSTNGEVLLGDDALGIEVGQLNKWSTGGNNADAMALTQPTPTPNGNFWLVQTPQPSGIVEWPVSMFVLNSIEQPYAQTNLQNVVFARFVNDPYKAPNCDISEPSNYSKCPYNATR